MSEAAPAKGIKQWAHVKHPGVRLYRRIMDGGSHFPSGFTSLGRNIETAAGIASVFATDQEWRSLNALIDAAEGGEVSEKDKRTALLEWLAYVRDPAHFEPGDYYPEDEATVDAALSEAADRALASYRLLAALPATPAETGLLTCVTCRQPEKCIAGDKPNACPIPATPAETGLLREALITKFEACAASADSLGAEITAHAFREAAGIVRALSKEEK